MSSFNIFHFISITVVNILDELALAKFSCQASPCKHCPEIKKILREKKGKGYGGLKRFLYLLNHPPPMIKKQL